MPTWPASLPQTPLAGTFVYTPDPNVVEFGNDVGNKIRRRRYTNARVVYQGAMHLVGTQIQALKDFYDIECASGVDSFTMGDWWYVTQGTPQNADFQFASPPEFTHVARDIFRVTLVLSKII